MKTKLLLFGFNKYLDFSVNPSSQVVKQLKREGLPHATFEAHVLPVSYRRVRIRLDQILKQQTFDLIIGFGLAPGINGMRLEKRALNRITSRKPDQDGVIRHGLRILPRRPEAYRTQVKLLQIQQALLKRHIPTTISHNPGGYVCNFSYFLILNHIIQKKLPTRCLFVHLPFSSELVCCQKWNRPSLPLPVLIEGGRILMTASLKCL